MAVEAVGEKYRCNICGNEVTVTTAGWHAPTKDTTSYVRVKDILVSGAGGR